MDAEAVMEMPAKYWMGIQSQQAQVQSEPGWRMIAPGSDEALGLT